MSSVKESPATKWIESRDRQASQSNDLLDRTKQFGLRVIKLCRAPPRDMPSPVIGKQLLRSGTSVGSNYRSAGRGRSTAEFLSKRGMVDEELDGSIYWLELLVEGGIVPKPRRHDWLRKANELTAMMVASIRTARMKRK